MATAKSLTPAEIEKVLHYIAQHSNSLRNRVMFLCTAQAGMRVGEVAGLTIGDVRNADGTVKSEIFLAAHRVKHEHARSVYISTRLQQEITDYIATRKWYDENQPLFYTQKSVRRGFTANTMTQHFFWLYKKAGVAGASSHSAARHS